MGLRINQNIAAMTSYRSLAVTDGQMSKSLEKLSSGFRINRAGDDAAGLAISEKLRGQVNGLNKASENAQNAISLIQTAEGGLSEQHSILQRMRELTVQSGSDTNTDDDREFIQDEIDALALELTRISTDTEFNGQKLLNATGGGGGGGTFNFQIGANSGQVIDVTIAASAATDLGVNALDVTTGTTAGTTTALDAIDDAIATVSGERSNLGANQNRLEHTLNNLNVSAENLAASESRIRDTDMAKEMTAFTRSQILSQAGTAMLAQANQMPQAVLSLLR